MIISDFQQKYAVLKAMRRFGGISKILLMKKLKSKVYVSFRISLYQPPTNKKEQMPPQRLFTLTRGIQIRGQPIKN